MIRHAVVALACCLGTGVVRGQVPSASHARELAAGHVYTQVSHALGDTLPFVVALPPSYDDSTFGHRRYPVVYVIDESVEAASMFRMVSGMVHFLNAWGPNWPHVIVVGLASKNPVRDFTPTRDSVLADGEVSAMFTSGGTGGASRYLDYLEEAFREVEARFRVTGNRTLISHGASALLGMHALSTRPLLFKNYLLIEPLAFWSQGATARAMLASLRKNPMPERRIMVARADVPRGTFGLARKYQRASVAIADLQRGLAALPSATGLTRSRFYQGEEHASVLVPATYDALRWFLGGQIAPEGMLADAPSLVSRSRRLGRQLGIDSVPDPNELSLAASSLLATTSSQQAGVSLLRLNVKHFPTSARAHTELADALAATGDTTGARAGYRSVLRLVPGDSVAGRRLRELGDTLRR